MHDRTLSERLVAGPVLADGAMATALHARGSGAEGCFEELNRSQPALVADVHRAYLDAGAEMVWTNSFAANPFKLRAFGLEAEVAALNMAAVAVAQRAVAATFRDAFIVGDVGPLGVRLAPYGRVTVEHAREAYREQVRALIDGGVHVIAFETMSDLREVTVAVEATRALGSLPLIAMMTFTRDDRTLLGDDAATAARTLHALGIEVIGVNCSGGPAQAMRLLTAMRQAVPAARFAVKPNAGWPEQVGGRIMYPATPEYFARYARAFVDAGAAIIGGCCGTTPAHIAAMRAALDQPARNVGAPSVISSAKRGGTQEGVAPSVAAPTQLAQRLASGRFVVSVELDPPRGLNLHKLTAGAQLLAEAGADVINVADSPMARMRMSPWAVCHVIERAAEIETVLHFPLRGRNLLRVQGDLLAAHALGLRNLFVVMGDPTAIGDYPSAMDAYDLVPSGLIRLLKGQLNLGVDHAGATIGEPTAFFVGCALNLCAADIEKEIRSVRKKIAAGADFALTQPVYDPALAHAFLQRYARQHGPLPIPIMVGVLPLYSARHAAFLHNEVPGISIPDDIRMRIEAAGGGAAATGVTIARELIDALRAVVQGVYLMPPFGRFDLAAEIIEGMR
jgi:homocysteine S-methyltransferase